MSKKWFPIFVLLALALAACGGPGATATPTNPDDNPGAPTPYPQPSSQAPGGDSPTVASPYPLPENPPAGGQPYPVPGYDPQPGDDGLLRGNAFPDLARSEMLQLESYPIQVTLILRGDLPTPCNRLRLVVSRDEAARKVTVEAYSVVEKGQVCTDVLEPFEASVPLGNFSGEKYQVFVNGELLGEITP